MTEHNTTDLLNYPDENKPSLPSLLNVLTILTFIGSGLALLFSIASPWFIGFSKKMMEQAASSRKELSTKELQQMEDGKRAMTLMEANLIPILAVGIIGALLCIAGAVMMRKLKKDGFWIYLAGELLPLITGFILMGTAQFNGVISVVAGTAVPLLFIILYASSLKYLVK